MSDLPPLGAIPRNPLADWCREHLPALAWSGDLYVQRATVGDWLVIDVSPHYAAIRDTDGAVSAAVIGAPHVTLAVIGTTPAAMRAWFAARLRSALEAATTEESSGGAP